MTRIKAFTLTATAAVVAWLCLSAWRQRNPAGRDARTAPMSNAAAMPRLPSLPELPRLPNLPGLPNVAGFSGAAPNAPRRRDLFGIQDMVRARMNNPGGALDQWATLQSTAGAPRAPDAIFGGF